MKELPYAQHMEHMGVGLNGELGEFCDALKKHIIYGKGVDPTGKRNKDGSPDAVLVKDGGVIDKVNLAEEGGDCFWYTVGYLPELLVSTSALQDAFNIGYGNSVLMNESDIKLITLVQVQVSHATYDLMTDSLPSEGVRTACIQIIGRNLGLLYGRFGLSLEASLDANIAKLAKRYGDKFSDVSALNRDTGAERTVLETTLAVPKSEVKGYADPGNWPSDKVEAKKK